MMRENTLEEFKRRQLEFLVILSSVLHKAEAQRSKWKTKLPQGNTGRVYIYEWDKWRVREYGLLCAGNRDFRIPYLNRLKDGSTSCQKGSSTGCTAGDFICQQNGFEYAEFVGTKDSYLNFIQEFFDNEIYKYFKSIYDLKKTDCLLDFNVAGMKCEKDVCSKLNDLEILDFKRIGGNCMKGSSSVFVHCKIPTEKNLKPKNGIWSDWRTESVCYHCGVENLKQQTRQCISKKEGPPDRLINLKKPVTCQGDWIKIRKCDACEQTDDYQYNAHYYGYDDSESYGSSYDDSYESEDTAYDTDYESGPTWDSNSDPYSNDEPYSNEYSYGSQSRNRLTKKKRHRRDWEDRHQEDANSCHLPEQKHDLSRYDPYDVKYNVEYDPVIPPTLQPTQSSTSTKKTSPIPVLPTSKLPDYDQPTINIGPELTTQSQSTAEPTVAAIGSTAMIGIIAAIAIAILGFVSYSFFSRKKRNNEPKSSCKLKSSEETKQLKDSKADLIVTNVPQYDRQTTQSTHISEVT